jgi:Flp pilus assembly protein TadG
MALFFVFLLLLVNVAFFVVARSAAFSAVDATARRAAIGNTSDAELTDYATAAIGATAPGAAIQSAAVTRKRDTAAVRVVYVWSPPGPLFPAITVTVESTAPLVVEP